MAWLSIAAGIIVGMLSWNLYRRFATDRIAEFNTRRRATSQFVGRGELVDGNRHLDVALALTPSSFIYENGDMQASLDLDRVEAIEYDTELVTGVAVAGGKVLRLRCHINTFEFVLRNDVVERWSTLLPPRSAAVAV